MRPAVKRPFGPAALDIGIEILAHGGGAQLNAGERVPILGAPVT